MYLHAVQSAHTLSLNVPCLDSTNCASKSYFWVLLKVDGFIGLHNWDRLVQTVPHRIPCKTCRLGFQAWKEDIAARIKDIPKFTRIFPVQCRVQRDIRELHAPQYVWYSNNMHSLL